MKLPHSIAPLIHPYTPAWSGRTGVPAFHVSRFWRDWLFDQGSLTARLISLDAGQFSVQLLRQAIGPATVPERSELGISPREPVWFREVILLLDNEPVIYARTAVPLTTLNSRARPLRSLGKRSLGAYLFTRADLQRSPVRAARCADNDLNLSWSRRSVFRIYGRPLMVSEAFSNRLPELAGGA